MGSRLAEDSALQRLGRLDCTQETIQTNALWMLHHRESAQVLVSAWLTLFKKAPEKRLALFYLMNDVAQRAKNKKDCQGLLDAFRPRVTEAIRVGRSNEKLCGAMRRTVEILGERGCFKQDAIKEMTDALDDKGASTSSFTTATQDEDEDGKNENQDDAALAELDEGELLALIEDYQKSEAMMSKARDILKRSKFTGMIKGNIKDRTAGKKMAEEMHTAATKMHAFTSALESHQRKCATLIDYVERGKKAFATHLRDVTVVEDAYQKFNTGLQDVRQELRELRAAGAFPDRQQPIAQSAVIHQAADMDVEDDDEDEPLDPSRLAALAGNHFQHQQQQQHHLQMQIVPDQHQQQQQIFFQQPPPPPPPPSQQQMMPPFHDPQHLAYFQQQQQQQQQQFVQQQPPQLHIGGGPMRGGVHNGFAARHPQQQQQFSPTGGNANAVSPAGPRGGGPWRGGGGPPRGVGGGFRGRGGVGGGGPPRGGWRGRGANF